MIAKPGNKTGPPLWPDPYGYVSLLNMQIWYDAIMPMVLFTLLDKDMQPLYIYVPNEIIMVYIEP